MNQKLFNGSEPPSQYQPQDLITDQEFTPPVTNRDEEAMRALLGDSHDPDILTKLGGPKFGPRRWTVGSSTSLIEGATPEPAWVTMGWIALPTVLALLLLAGMLLV